MAKARRELPRVVSRQKPTRRESDPVMMLVSAMLKAPADDFEALPKAAEDLAKARKAFVAASNKLDRTARRYVKAVLDARQSAEWVGNGGTGRLPFNELATYAGDIVNLSVEEMRRKLLKKMPQDMAAFLAGADTITCPLCRKMELSC